MQRQAAAAKRGRHILRRPVDQRVDLDAAVDLLEPRQRLALAALEALAPGDPGSEAVEGAAERLDLAQEAAVVRRALC
jgi:hypothetical protein